MSRKTKDEKFLKESPPRYIDFYSQMVLILSGFLQQFGWGFFSFGMIFFWIFGMQSSFTTIFRPMGETVEVKGTYISGTPTSNWENEVQVYRHVFTYIDNFREYEGESYGSAKGWTADSEVNVLYSKDHPERSFLEGTRRSVFSGWVLFVGLFPLIGLIFILIRIRKNVHFLRMLRQGRAAKGNMSDKRDTGGSITINNRRYPIYEYTFKFDYQGETFEAKATTHRTETVEDEKREIILFDELDPKHNMVFDAVDGAPRIDEKGYLKPAPPWKLVLFILPAISIIINLIGYFLTTM